MRASGWWTGVGWGILRDGWLKGTRMGHSRKRITKGGDANDRALNGVGRRGLGGDQVSNSETVVQWRAEASGAGDRWVSFRGNSERRTTGKEGSLIVILCFSRHRS